MAKTESKVDNKEVKFRLLDADEIECRVGQQGTTKNGMAWCSLLLYKDARCDMKRLDEVFGTEGWQRHHKLIGNCLVCTISIYDPTTQQWIEKEDVGTPNKTEAEKSMFSDSFKRAATNVGIGRELYTAPKIFLNLEPGDMRGDKIKATFKVVCIGYTSKRIISKLVIADGNGRPRYFYGVTPEQYNEWLAKQNKPVEVARQPQDGTTKDVPQQSNPTTGDEALDKELSTAINQISAAKNVKELIRIWNAFPSLQGLHAFTANMSAKRIEVSKK